MPEALPVLRPGRAARIYRDVTPDRLAGRDPPAGDEGAQFVHDRIFI